MGVKRNKPGPKSKKIEERTLPKIKPLQQVERSYSREQKIQILCFLYHYRESYIGPHGDEQTRKIR